MNWLFESPLIRSLTGLCVFLLLVLALPKVFPLPELTDDEMRINRSNSVSEFLEVLPASLTEAYARPLFHGNRRPPEAVVVRQAAPVAPRQQVERFTLELVGVMGSAASGRTVFILDSSTGDTTASREGEVVQGWLVESIEADSVVLSNEKDTKTLVIGSGG
ncbi:MAG: hypothetical protein JJ850_12620 [Kordiimonadaceae bacterium]|nr:hypothetical protein [Kordiimonadaceae bacterium]MBO6568585.1 hypothetical protein [Kordiimonadaceae bacterium]MBO6965460.1 hypothetical protein [Kordiimonadaceae bacterium]